jgi:GntR family transcriptional regulator of arabinose operon
MPAKYHRLADQLRSNIRSGLYAEAGRLPSEDALAEAFGVSRQTVRQALHLLAQEGRIEKRKGSGSRIVSAADGKGRHVAVVTSYIDDYIFPAVLQDIQSVLAEHGYVPLVYATQNLISTERQVLQRLLQENVCGVLMEGVRTALPNPNLDLYAQLAKKGIPCVFLYGCSAELREAVCVGDDNYGGGYLLTRQLASMGHQHIAGIFKSDDMQGVQRYAGYTAALRDAGLSLPSCQTLWYTTEDRRDFLDAGNMTLLQNFIQSRLEDSTAIVCYNDEIAYLLIRLLGAAGRRVPEDLSVASFDNSYYSDAGPVRITSLGHERHIIGRTAAEALIDLIAGVPRSSISIPWTLAAKDSTSPRKEA